MSDEDFTLDGIDTQNDYDDLPVGTYTCVIDDCEVGTAKTGTPQLRVQFKVVLGEHAGRVTSDWIYFTQAAAGVVLTKITAAGVEPPKGIKGGDAYAKALMRLLHGKHADIVIRVDTYNGESRNKVKAWKKAPGDLAFAPTGAGPSPTAATDEDIPF